MVTTVDQTSIRGLELQECVSPCVYLELGTGINSPRQGASSKNLTTSIRL